jgi:ubiquitin-associated SH3 domain-containing protein
MMFKPNWHGLELKASGLKNLIAHFVEIMNSQPIEEKIRLKEWLHLSFAYNFQPQHHDTLKTLAEKMINPQALTQWELRFYHKYPDWTWTCLQSWLL